MGDGSISWLCREVATLLANFDCRVVFAESCTAGLVSASLAAVPGISRYHCGSAVAYRPDTKTQWLGVAPELLQRHTAVSDAVTRNMAAGVLQRTPEALIAAAVTGHLGPEAPVEQDGCLFVAVAYRDSATAPARILTSQAIRLASADRASRQGEAAAHVLELLRRTLLTLDRKPADSQKVG